jgi:hypothetical protein
MCDNKDCTYSTCRAGRSKREDFALAILAALASRPDKYLPHVPDAVALADRLIQELSK